MEEEAHLNQICQQLAERGEYEAILLISKTNKTAHEVCHKYVKHAIMNNSFPAKKLLEKIIFDTNKEIRPHHHYSNQYLTLYKVINLGQQYQVNILQSLMNYWDNDLKDDVYRRLSREILSVNFRVCHQAINTLNQEHKIAPMIALRYHQLIPEKETPLENIEKKEETEEDEAPQLGGSESTLGRYLLKHGRY